jgi:Uma2 family endonuclease
MVDFVEVHTITEADVMERETHEGVGREIVNGEWAETTHMAGLEHAVIGGNIYAALRAYLASKSLGKAYPDGLTYVLKGTPEHIEVMRLPDVSFISQAKLDTVGNTKGFVYFAPDIAAEVVSPSKRTDETNGKIEDYLRYGTQQVWIVYPDQQRMVIHFADGRIRTIDDTLTCEELLPDFRLPLTEVFEQ